MVEVTQGYAPCPLCKQYSHSIGCDALAAAFNHFQSMYAHPVRGHPMGHHFEEATRDAAQLLMAAARDGEQAIAGERAAVVAWLRKAEVQHLGIEFGSASRAANAIERGVHHDGEG